jgi:hypothetical protein
MRKRLDEDGNKPIGSTELNNIVQEILKKLRGGIKGKECPRLLRNNLHKKKVNCIKKIMKIVIHWQRIQLNVSHQEIEVSDYQEFERNIKIKTNISFLTLSLDYLNNGLNFRQLKDEKNLNQKIELLKSKFLITTRENKDIILQPIFIWLNQSNIIMESTIRNVYCLINNIKATIQCENFIVFLFIEKNCDSEKSEKYMSSLCELIKLIKSIDREIESSVVFVYVDDEDIELNKQKSYMFLLAEHFKLIEFYEISDQVGNFLEYSSNFEDFKFHKNSTVRALNYMSKVLSNEIYSNQDLICDSDLLKLKGFIGHLSYNSLINEDVFTSLDNSIENYKQKKKIEELMPIKSFFEALDVSVMNDKDKKSISECIKIVSSSKEKYINYVTLVPIDIYKTQANLKLKSRLSNHISSSY